MNPAMLHPVSGRHFNRRLTPPTGNNPDVIMADPSGGPASGSYGDDVTIATRINMAAAGSDWSMAGPACLNRQQCYSGSLPSLQFYGNAPYPDDSRYSNQRCRPAFHHPQRHSIPINPGDSIPNADVRMTFYHNVQHF